MNDNKLLLQSTFYQFLQKESFYGGLIQEITMKFNNYLPTAGILFNKTVRRFEVHINPEYFNSLTLQERVALLHHEVLHFTNKHLTSRALSDKTDHKQAMYENIAADMAINQFITNLPKGCVNVEDWKMEDGKPFPKFKSMEFYNTLIKQEEQNQKGRPKNNGNVSEMLDKYVPFDSHDWEELTEEEKKAYLEEAKKIVKRTIEKTSFSHTTVPDAIKDFLQDIEIQSVSMNHKQILKDCIKKTVSSVDRVSTWKKPNKRYGIFAPNTKMDEVPKCTFYIDTSGSISVTEMNAFFNVMQGFLKAGSRNCILALWHTDLYYSKSHKIKKPIEQSMLESGGTDVNCVFENIAKTSPNLSIILTDGYYESSTIKTPNQVLWIISKGGNKDHPMKHVGKTICLENLM